jgi:flagellar basal-body rod protein FlgG
MSGAFNVAAVGLDAQQRALDILASNIANVNTPGYKRAQVQFAELVSSGADPDRLRADLGASILTASGVEAHAQYMMDEAGRIENTGQALDIAINGRGFIELMGPEGQTVLWRGGTLKIGEDGLLSTAGGLALKAAITIPDDAENLTIGADGVVRAVVEQGGEPTEIGQLMLVRVDDPAALERLDGGLYRLTDATRMTEARPGEDGAGLLVQGGVERSNVDLSNEMVQLMLVQRAYAANAQVVQAADQLMAIANGLKR